MEPHIHIAGLTVLRGDREVLAGLDLSLGRGEVFGLLGPNGAGKTTAFLALCGLIPAKAGTVTLAGTSGAPGSPALLARTGVVFQSPALDGRLSARVNLRLAGALHGLGGKALTDRVAAMLEFAGLADRARDPVRRLSGGMRRRLEIGRALLHEPPFLILDEPTTGLDQPSWRRTWDMFRRLAADGATLLITTHRAEEAELCDRLGFLEGGRLAAVDTPEGFRAALGEDVVEVTVDDPGAAAARLREELGVAAEARAGRVFLETARGAELVPRVAELFPRGALRSVSVHRPSLADAFLKLTGRDLSGREEGAS